MSSSPFRTPQPPVRGRSEFHNASSGKPPRHPSSDTKDSANRSSARNLASSSLMMSPGLDGGLLAKNILSPSASINTSIATPRSEGKKSSAGSESPFREWATNSLGCLANDVVSPSHDAAMLPPSYDQPCSVKMEDSPMHMHNMASRDEDMSIACKPAALEQALTEDATPFTEHATAFPPSGLGQGTRCGGSVAEGQKGTSMAIKAEAPDSWQERSDSGDGQEDRAEETESEDDMDDVDGVPALDALKQHLLTPQGALNGATMRKAVTLVECHLFTFELCDNKVESDGFDDRFVEAHPWVASSLLSRCKSRPVPCTPALQVDAHDDMADYKDDSESRKRICSCKKSRCLKLYCECFAAGDLCDGCKCVSCANDGEHETQRLVAVDNIKQRNALAFAPKIVDEEMDKPVGAHARGCRCKKSHCLKKYCECFQAQVKCTDKCKCEDCKNVSLRGPDETPGERQRSEAALRGLLQLSGSKASLSPDERASLTAHKRHADTLSASRNNETLSGSRNKKPRVLDFNVTATTPSHSTPSAPMRLDAGMLGSPSALLMQALLP